MNAIDLTPFYRNSIGFDRLGSLINHALTSEPSSGGYPPYNIEVLDENQYAITLAVAGFEQAELDIKLEQGVLTVRGEKANTKEQRKYLHQGIAHRAFERKFTLADYVEVTDASLNNGLLTVRLVREIPEAMKPRRISISQRTEALEDKSGQQAAGETDQAA